LPPAGYGLILSEAQHVNLAGHEPCKHRRAIDDENHDRIANNSQPESGFPHDAARAFLRRDLAPAFRSDLR
jgi:hypothetical protein